MHPFIERLADNFVLLNLGAGADTDYKAPPEILKTITVVELDGGNQPIQTSNVYHQKHRINEWVSGTGGPRTFFKRAYWGCSGLADEQSDVVARYGLESFHKLESAQLVQTRALAEVVRELGITRVDFLKTDLEGIDFEVIQNMENFLPTTLALQSELRFTPVYAGETPCEEVVAWCRAREFEVVGLKPEYWKPKHPNWTQCVDGNIVWADFLFMRTPVSVRRLAEREGSTLPLQKHILLAALLGKLNHACHLLGLYAPWFPEDELTVMSSLIMRFTKTNPGLIGPAFIPGFPHISNPQAA